MPNTSEMFYPYSGSVSFVPGQRVYSLVPNPGAPPNYVKVGLVLNVTPSASAAPRDTFFTVRWDRDSTTEMVPVASMSIYPPVGQSRLY